MSTKKAKRCSGDILKIQSADGKYWYGRVLEEPLIAFYDLETTDEKTIDEILASPIIFKIWVMNAAITSGRWEIIGNRQLEDALAIAPDFFKQDPITKQLSIYSYGKERPAKLEECLNLERAAVWSAQHVEDRLSDHFKGQPNRWAQSLALKK